MKVQMIVGRAYAQVLAHATALHQREPGITVSIEALEYFQLFQAGNDQPIYDSDGGGPIYLARVNSGVFP